MSRTVDYYFALVSPWSYLGHDRFAAICAKHGASVNVNPIDLSRVFPVSGGLPLAKRAPQRQAYRLVELARWRTHLGVPLNVQPKFAGSGGDLGAKWILAARERGAGDAMELTGAFMRARWAEERDIADPAALAGVAGALGQDAAALAARAGSPEIATKCDALTQQAIDGQVFGVPWYVVDGEPFWGQDRLDFLDRKLAQ
jgi:2-hydroxychromene-2-carboxylate isomerase